MKSRDELYRLARDWASDNRQRAVMQAHQDNEKIYQALPGLKPLEDEARRQGSQAMLAALEGDTAKRAAALEAVARIASEKKALLASAGYPENALEPRYTCPICKDTGKSQGLTCQCVHQRVRVLRREEINRSSPLQLSDFSSFSLEKYPNGIDPELGGNLREYMGKMLAFAQKYAQEFTPDSRNLLFTGSAGLGKTKLALSIADRVLNQGYDVIYASAADLMAQLDREHFQEGDSLWMDTVKEADLLILDDLGTEFLNSYTTSALYELVNHRLLTHRATIYTTNIIDPGVIQSRYTEKIASRILGNCKMIRFFGQDLRVRQSLKKG